METGLTPDQIVEEKAKSLQNPALRGLAEDRLKRWYSEASQKAPGDAINIFKAIRSFCKANYVPLSAKIPTYVQQREEIYIPKKAEVKAMCELANLETATFTLFAAESGQRDGTIADLEQRLKSHPPAIKWFPWFTDTSDVTTEMMRRPKTDPIKIAKEIELRKKHLETFLENMDRRHRSWQQGYI